MSNYEAGNSVSEIQLSLENLSDVLMAVEVAMEHGCSDGSSYIGAVSIVKAAIYNHAKKLEGISDELCAK